MDGRRVGPVVVALGAALVLGLVVFQRLPQGSQPVAPSPGASQAPSQAPDAPGPSATPRAKAGPISLGPAAGERATLELYFFATADVRFRHHPVGVVLEGQGLPQGTGQASGVTDAAGRLVIELPAGTYTLTPSLGERSLLFMGEGQTSPEDWPRSGSGWGVEAPASLPSLTLTLAAGEVSARYTYDADNRGPRTNAVDVTVLDAEGAPVAAVVEAYALDDLSPRPNRGVIFYAPKPGPPPPPIAHPGLLKPRTRGLADTQGLLILQLSPGRRRIVARAGYRIGQVDLELDELREAPFRAEVTLSETIQRGGVLVRLSGAGGGPPQAGRYVLRAKESAPYATHEAKDLALALHDLPPGQTQLFVERDGQRVGELSVEVQAGQTLERTLTLP